MKKKLILFLVVMLVMLSACQNEIMTNQSIKETDEIEIDDKINEEVVKVITNHITAIHTSDEELIRSTVLDQLDFGNRAFTLWDDNSTDYEIKKMEYGLGDEKNEVVSVTFTNNKLLSFALTKRGNGWKIYDVD